MAEIQLYKIQFLQNNVAGVFIAGEVLDVYIDDTIVVNNPLVPGSNTAFTTGIQAMKVYRNGSLIGNGPLIDTLPGRTSIVTYSPTVCASTSLVVPQITTIFPYAWYYTLDDHPSCAFNSATCDLIMNGPPLVTPASGENVNDGEITITATSTNPIEYNINSDFTYGNGQVSGTFSNLLPGNYRIFVRDDKNCAFNVLVQVGFDNTFGVKYRCEYTDFRTGLGTKIEILERLYVGSVTEVKAGSSPIVLNLRGEGSTDKFAPVLSTSADIALTTEVDQEFIQLYTSDPNQYRVTYYQDNGSGYELKFTGKVLPFIWQEDHREPPYYINITATDGLPELKDYYLFQPDGAIYTGTISIIKLVAFVLKKINLGLNIRVAANIYATGMDTTAADDPFDQAYIDFERFYLETKEPSYEFVLQSILEPFGARLIQWENRWNIIRVEEMGTTYAWREFDADGNYVTNGTTNPLVDIDIPSEDGVMYEAYPSVEIQNGYGLIRVNYKLGLKENVLENGDFGLTLEFNSAEYKPVIDKRGWSLVAPVDYALFDQYEIIENQNVVWSFAVGDRIKLSTQAGEAYIQSKNYNLKMGSNNTINIKLRYNMKLLTVNWRSSQALSYPYIRLRTRIKYGSLYLNTSGDWQTTATTCDFFITRINEYQESEITAIQPESGTPLDGMNLDIRVYIPTPFFVGFQTLAELRAEPTIDTGVYLLPNGSKAELRDTFAGYISPINYDKIYYYELEETTLAESGYDVVQPNDYNGTTNPRKWVLKTKRPADVDGVGRYVFSLDKVEMKFLTDGNDPIDTIIRTATGEKNNRLEMEKDLIFGSSGDLIVTQGQAWLQLRAFFPRIVIDDSPTATRTVVNILSSDLIYTGWLRSSTGTPWDLWTRDGIAESERLHGIWLKMVGFQYNRSWRLMRARLTSKTQKFSMLSSFRDVNDGIRYIPISVNYDDKNNQYSVDLLELRGTWIDDGGSDGSGTAPFTSAFTTGFGSGYN